MSQLVISQVKNSASLFDILGQPVLFEDLNPNIPLNPLELPGDIKEVSFRIPSLDFPLYLKAFIVDQRLEIYVPGLVYPTDCIRSGNNLIQLQNERLREVAIGISERFKREVTADSTLFEHAAVPQGNDEYLLGSLLLFYTTKR